MGREARVKRGTPKTTLQPKLDITNVWSADQLKANLLKKREKPGIIDIVLPEASAGRTLTVPEQNQ